MRIGPHASDIVFKSGKNKTKPDILPQRSYDARKDFSSRQGDHQWFYQSWDGKYFVFLDWAKTRWKGKGTRPAILSNGNMVSGKEAVVKGWLALKNGKARIRGTVKKRKKGKDDSIRARIALSHKDELKTVWPERQDWPDLSVDSKSIHHDCAVDVEAGDMIYFMVSGKNALGHDEVVWNPQISLTVE